MLDEVVHLVSAQLLGPVADPAHHLLLHDEMRDVEGRVADNAAAAAHQQPGPAVLAAQVEPQLPDAGWPRRIRSKSSPEVSTRCELGSTDATTCRADSP